MIADIYLLNANEMLEKIYAEQDFDLIKLDEHDDDEITSTVIKEK